MGYSVFNARERNLSISVRVLVMEVNDYYCDSLGS